MKCPICGRIWRVPGPVPNLVTFPQLTDTPPFSTPVKGFDEEVSLRPTLSSSNPEQVDEIAPLPQRKITQVYLCPNLWCDYMIHDTPERPIAECKRVFSRSVFSKKIDRAVVGPNSWPCLKNQVILDIVDHAITMKNWRML